MLYFGGTKMRAVIKTFLCVISQDTRHSFKGEVLKTMCSFLFTFIFYNKAFKKILKRIDDEK